MTISQAIQKAIEGGWKPNFEGYELYLENPPKGHPPLRKLLGVDAQPLSEILLDPLFWQFAFGKENGRMKALELLNHLFDGGTIEEYFKKLELPDLREEKEEKV